MACCRWMNKKSFHEVDCGSYSSHGGICVVLKYVRERCRWVGRKTMRRFSEI